MPDEKRSAGMIDPGGDDRSGTGPTAAPATTAETVAALVARRRRIREWWQGKDAWADQADAAAPIGMAFSGGGIRSATFALGLIQGMAKSSRDALGRIDILSTVSGGGYAGCFLRSLFVPTSRRGIEAVPVPPNRALDRAIVDQYALARRALASGPNEREILWQPSDAAAPTRLRNPMWWLREHSRYLAPTGPTDYGFAIAYVARNWLAMIYLFMLACTAIATIIVFAESAVITLTHTKLGSISIKPFMIISAGLLKQIGMDKLINISDGQDSSIALSPIFMIIIVPIVNIIVLFIAYWATQAMSGNERNSIKQRESLSVATRQITFACFTALILLVSILGIVAWFNNSTILSVIEDRIGRSLAIAIVCGIIIAMAGSMTAVHYAQLQKKEASLLTAQLRLALTNRLTKANLLLIVIVAIALIDSLGAAVDRALHFSIPSSLSVALLPIIAFLIKKLPDWFGGTGKSAIGSLAKRFATSIALVIGFILYGLIAVAAAALVHDIAWEGEAWSSAPRWPRLILFSGLAWILAYVSGKANGFINLSSLHALYGARLTRAYLGASNVERLELAAEYEHPRPITENHPCDYIQPRVYGELDLPAPIHLINVTLNETIDPRSQIVARDRKGDIMSLEPGGVRIGSDLVDWGRLTNDPPDPERTHAENVSLGQWIAISGAAASSGMGRMTSLGFALAFTFANVRLGYWWWAPKVCPDMPQTLGFKGWVAQHFGTFVYLANEMTCRYSRGYDRKYLTDGGHYENSGAYTLIRRRVPLILVTDNGADPDYQFEDLQTLIRQVRIDLGGETEILGGDALAAFLATLGTNDPAIFVDPVAQPAWRKRMTVRTDPAYVLALRVTLGDELVHLVWIKPRLLPDIPTDIVGYATTMTSFPQQPTGDQFFDEAQWESYRRLGEVSMTRLLDACPKLLA